MGVIGMGTSGFGKAWLILAAATLVGGTTADPAEPPPPAGGLRKPTLADTVKASMYADNWFSLYVNGELVAVDPIAFLPHNVVTVDLLPDYPMTIAVLARDNADPRTGMEYADTNIGDGGFILKFGDGTVTSGSWKAKCFSRGPIGGDTKNPRVESEPLPEGWEKPDFDDSRWDRAQEYSEREIDPKQPYYDTDFAGATFIWTDDLLLDNTVIFRHRVEAPPDGPARPDFSGLSDVVPEGPQRPGGRRPPGNRAPPRGRAR
jgi:hypothetical protein